MDLAIKPGSYVALLGPNGSGKSTLIKAIAGLQPLTAGALRRRDGLRLGVVFQHPALDPLLTVRENLRLQASLFGMPEAHDTIERLCGEQAIDDRLDDRVKTLSGGLARRVEFVRAILAEPDLLLLDEPTNYLDLEGAVWLESYLKHYPGTVLLISHDRDLLNGAVDRIAHLKGGKVTIFEGGYDTFERTLAERQRLQMKLKAKQDDERRHLQSFIDRFKAKASKAKQAQSRVKRLEKMQPVATIIDDPVAPFDFPAPQRDMAPPLMRLEGTVLGYGDKVVLRDLNLRIDPDDRIGILGRNGSGKSTLAKLLAGKLEPLDGHFRRHKKTQVAYFAQHQMDALSPEHSAYDHVVERMPDATEAQRRARLATFGLPIHLQETPARKLSGGEKARLLFNLIVFEGPHLILMDEPTNHLDMDS
ncbi:MAG: ABC-F family ATP-binding cassette domain-containing protein, partial [Phycisphaerales bacterium]